MKYTRSLRYRITLSFFLFGLILAAGIATGANFGIEDIEERLLAESLDQEFNYFLNAMKSNGDLPMLETATLKTYVADVGHTEQLPPVLRDLAPGDHEIDDHGRHYQARVGNLNGKRLYLLRDITLFEQRENAIVATLVVLVILSSGVALWVGYGLSQKVIAPVSNLAISVAKLTPEKPEQPMSPQYAQDEVGELAQAFDHYLARLRDFIEREQEFTSNASHELRTPLTVIGGAVEILAADPALNDRSRKVLLRVERAAKEMSQVVDALLFLAREHNGARVDGAGERARVIEVVNESIEDARHLLNGKPVTVSTRYSADIELAVPKIALAIVLGNLLRNAFAYTKEGEVSVIVEDDRIEVRDTGVGIKPADLPHIFSRHYRGGRSQEHAGSGLGLSIVKRICDRNRWRIEIDDTQEKGTAFIIHLTS